MSFESISNPRFWNSNMSHQKKFKVEISNIFCQGNLIPISVYSQIQEKKLLHNFYNKKTGNREKRNLSFLLIYPEMVCNKSDLL